MGYVRTTSLATTEIPPSPVSMAFTENYGTSWDDPYKSPIIAGVPNTSLRPQGKYVSFDHFALDLLAFPKRHTQGFKKEIGMLSTNRSQCFTSNLLYLLVFSFLFVSVPLVPSAFATPESLDSESSKNTGAVVALDAQERDSDLRAKQKKKKNSKKKKKKGNNQGKSDVTINMKDRVFRYNLAAPFLRHKATVEVCNKDKFIHEPWSTAGSGVNPETHFFGEVIRGCRKKTYVNTEDDINKLQFYDSIHPDETAAFCMYPKDQKCRKGAYTTNETGGVLECELQEKCCSDEKDNDNDGDVDCDDPDCIDDEKCDCQEGEHAASKVIETGNLPNCGCYVAVFVQWSAIKSKNAESVTAVHTHVTLGEQTTSSADPYDNEFSIGSTSVPSPGEGINRIHVAGATAFDSNLDRCSPNCTTSLQNAQSNISDPKVRITCPTKKK